VERKITSPNLGSTGLAVLVVDATIVFSQEVERTADQIIAATPDDPMIRANALRWKTYATSAAFAAGGHGDPAASLLDLWVLAVAQQRFFEDHAVELFGEQHKLAVATATELTRRIALIWDAVAPSAEDRAEAQNLVRKLASTNPVTDLYYVRKPIDPRVLQAFLTEVSGLVNVAHDIQRSVASLQRLLRAHAAILPRQIRWQAELATLDLSRLYGLDPETAAHEVGRLQTSLEDIGQGMEQLTPLVTSERETILRSIHMERVAVLGQLDVMLRQTRGWASGETALLRDTIARERELLLAAVEEQRTAAVRDVEAAADRATGQITRSGHILLREAFLGLLLLWAIVLVSGTAAAILVRRLSRSGKPGA